VWLGLPSGYLPSFKRKPLARKILLADDSVTAQNMGRKILADAGYEVITVNNGSAALKKIAEHKPDLIVLDVYMPGYSGLEVCQRLKEAQETSRVPVLLTVGKLEPFKPEEAKRARADGFIVKPFEASELLSALSKLEDKIVPRPESSKPGRFARANAALDEAKYDKTVAVDEDSSWKNRIGFPKKKSKAEAAQDEDDSSFYNPMNKDLRTVVEHRPSVTPPAARQEGHTTETQEDRVDLGALAPEGLPKDVTPEEIAALAAAAAQVKGKIAEARFSEGKFAEEDRVAESKFAEPVSAETRPEPKAAESEPTPPAFELPREITAAAPPVATFAEQKSEEKNEAKVEAKSAEEEKKTAAAETFSPATPEAGSVAHPSHDDLMAAIAALEPDPVPSPGAGSEKGSGNGSWLHDAADSNAADSNNDEPVTMAVAAAAAAGLASSTSRWSAVAVALAPEDAAVSLELEMQKAYAALAAAEAVQAPVLAAIPEPQLQETQTAPPQEIHQPAPVLEASSPAEGARAEAMSEPAAAAPTASPEPEAAQALSTAGDAAATNAAATNPPVSNAAAEAMTEAVKELEAVAAAYAEQMKPSTAAPEASAVENFDFKATPAHDTPSTVTATVEARTEYGPAVPSSTSETSAATTPPALEVPNFEPAKPDAPQAAQPEPSQPEIETPKNEEIKNEDKKNEEVKSEVQSPVVVPVAATEEAPVTAAATSGTAPAFVNEVPAESASVVSGVVSSQMIPSESEIVSSDVISTEMAAVLGELAAGGIFDMAKKESEIAATTAAAWASWRRIRETGDAKAAPASSESAQKEESAAPHDAAAMAAAAGAEKAPEARGPEPDSDDIAGIVDSVLADLRPKIVEEISRKMGKKK
jgi:CheY-like chemotaxis protein